MKWKQNNGLTLLEIIIAIVILGIVTVSLLAGFLSGYSGIVRMGQRTNSVTEAQAIIDYIYQDTLDNGFDGLTTTVDTILASHGIAVGEYEYALTFSGLETRTLDENYRIYIEPAETFFTTVVCYQVTVLTYLPGNKGTVKISTYIPNKGVN